VDANGNEFIDPGDCAFGLIGATDDAGLGDGTDGADILANTSGDTNPCGFGSPHPVAANNGLVDWNSDALITAADSCIGCFFGHDLANGFVVQAAPTCPGHASDPRNQVVGTGAADALMGTAGVDVICGLGGNDTISGLGGNDLLVGGAGSDTVGGGTGADTLVGGGGRDTLRGGLGSDEIMGGRGNDLLYGGRGNDHLFGGPGNDLGVGGPGRDTVAGCESGQA
jgi:Ca2+-binding RTX toxin-like protein